ncbi:MAG TPA: Gfo/Idh/MocA family oxidoreductase [Caldilineaceae bacterium]|nr:Gfo/Idh/MocA family oxidoreductase [Caldilineaceae bacterium]
MARVYRGAVVGAGSGGKLSLKALAQSPRYELVAVADLQAAALASASALYPGIQTFADHRQMLAECALDVVCVSTWPPSHLAITRDALAAGLKGILVEKPLGDTWAHGRQVIEAVRAARLPMVVPHGLLVADHGRAILEQVAQGAIGALKLVEIECAGWDIINAGIHWLNFVVSLLPQDPFRSVLAVCDGSTRTYRDGMQVETEAVTYAYTAAGVRVVMHTGDLIPVAQPGEGTLFRLAGSHGLLEFFGWKPRYRLVNPEHPQGVEVEVAAGPKSNHERYLDLLADQMDAGRADYTLAERSLAALELCEAAYLASHHRCAVTLPLQSFVPPPVSDWQPGAPYSGTGGGRDGRRLAQIAR